MSDGEQPVARLHRRATAADVAERSGVSRATVSYVLNRVEGQTIPPSTQERVRSAAAELGYVPSAAAASLRRGHSRIILVVTDPALAGFVTEPFLGGIAQGLTAGGYVPLTHQYTTEEAVRAAVSAIRPYGVLSLTALSPELMGLIREAGVPSIYTSAHGDPTFPRPWEEEIGYTQATVLIEGGAEMLIYAAPSPDNPRTVIARSREIGVAAACAALGSPAPLHIDVGHDPAAASTDLRRLAPGDRAVGICAFDDEVASVTLKAVQLLGRRIPEQVRVIGVDDVPFAPFLSPPLTTIAVDGRETGQALAQRFLSAGSVGDSGEVSRAHARVVRRASA